MNSSCVWKCKKFSAKAANATSSKLLLEEAPRAVLQELNTVRLQLADAQRGERQARRRVDDLQQRNTSLIHEREQALLSCRRLPVVEQELTVLRREYETILAQHAAWKRFEQELVETTTLTTMMQSSPTRPGVASSSSSSSGSATSARKSSGITTTTGGPPPDVSTIERFLREAKNRVADLERQKQALHDECQQLRQANLPLQKELLQLQHEQRERSRERRQMQAQLETSRRNLQQAETQQAIYQRETVELQNLIKTCDNPPFAANTTTTTIASTPGRSVFALSSPKGDINNNSSSVKTLELTLSTKRQELDLALQEKERLNKEKVELSQELETVKTKFGKLRDALLTERSKAQEAEQRANAAEALAGKGSFDPETTRVLHLQETPLATTLKEEIQVLQRQLEVAKAAAPSSSSKKSSLSNSASKSSTISVDAEKLNKRLKENFKEQIALFREGVYLMTGFKVDMLPGTDRPTFRVRSVYAEREEDHLLLKWPKPPSSSSGGASGAASDSSSVKFLDVLNTDFAKNLTTTSSYEYMTKFSSLPAFLAAVQLNLFEKQTVMISK
jgi:Mitotic checkpoint protein